MEKHIRNYRSLSHSIGIAISCGAYPKEETESPVWVVRRQRNDICFPVNRREMCWCFLDLSVPQPDSD